MDSNDSNRAALVCQTLRQQVTGTVTTPQEEGYEAEQERPWSRTCWLSAAAYIRPQSTAEVAAVLATLKKTNTKFAVRSTGHHPTANFSSVGESGVVIDLRDINFLALDEGGDGSLILRAGGGSTWGNVYTFLEERGRSIVGARNFGVGLGGFTLGGGMSAFPNLHGLPADGVKNFEVVLGDSRVVNANLDTNPDLWKAIKGGGTNFGIVTRLDFETHPLIKTKYAVHLYDPADYVNVLKATVRVQDSMETDPKIGLFVSFNPTFVAVGLLYADSLAESMTATKVSLDLYIKSHELYLAAIRTSAAGLFYTIQPVTCSAVREGEDRGGNIMGVEKVAQDWWVGAGAWQDADLDEQAIRDVDNLRIGVEQLAISSGDHLGFFFMNDASPTQTVLGSYGASSLQQMMDVSDKYDPNKVFQVLQNGGNLLRNIS
ncbi:6-hydroxy-D-nicotine oxidase [Apiospora sp. TS-2023a]